MKQKIGCLDGGARLTLVWHFITMSCAINKALFVSMFESIKLQKKVKRKFFMSLYCCIFVHLKTTLMINNNLDRHCSTAIVRPPLFDRHCSTAIVRPPLFVFFYTIGINTKMLWADTLLYMCHATVIDKPPDTEGVFHFL